MIRLGFVDCDTSHVVQFTRRLHHVDIAEDQWIDGAQIVAAYPGKSDIVDQSRIDEYVEELRKHGVEIVDAPEDLLGKVDGVLIESNEGGKHRRHAEVFLPKGIPCFIDKPFTCSVADAKAIARMAEEAGVPVFSSSSLRYGLEIQELKAREAEIGRVVGADAYSPASIHPRNPGLFHYGIHAVETLYALMGPGCESVWCVFTGGAETVVGLWTDERIGSIRGTREGGHSYGFTAFCEKAVVAQQINANFIYRELLGRIVEMFQTGKAPLDIGESIEIAAFIEAALRSTQFDGKRVDLKV